MKTLSITFLSIITTVLLLSFTMYQNQPKPWPVPAESKNKVNPVKSTTESINEGKALYNKNCAMCHGKTGLGNGPKAKMLETFSGDFSGSTYQSQTDGEHFYKTLVGRDEMPAYKGKISEEGIWQMVNYMRTFKK